MIKIGTDCSGIEAPIEALFQLIEEGKIPYQEIRHIFSSEIDKWCIQSIEANYSPEKIYYNLLERDNSLVKKVDLYVCGFPCQPFSIAGKRKGLLDARGTIIYKCIDYIQNKSPKYFILENVKGLISDRTTWEVIFNLLQKCEEHYSISYQILNTKDYGIPQNRERLFIVGIRKDIQKHPFQFPKPLRSCTPLSEYIDLTDTHQDPIRQDVLNSGMLEKIPKDAVFVDFSFKKAVYPNSNVICPCITADSRTWCVPMSRYANIKERLSLQGFRSDIWKQVVSNTQMKKQIGNSISVNVLKALILQIFKCVGDVL